MTNKGKKMKNDASSSKRLNTKKNMILATHRKMMEKPIGPEMSPVPLEELLPPL